ncbi:MAG TPA: ComEC/Rec2 family competence protein [Acetobacteraceae bacterium]|nr:ComEC/Rec2 family competence protein [Acetobacteraceae bacterium]
MQAPWTPLWNPGAETKVRRFALLAPGKRIFLASLRARIARSFALWLAAEHQRFILWLPVAMLAGVLAYFDLDDEPSLWLGPAIAASGLVLALTLRRHPPGHASGWLAFAFGLGIASATLATASAQPFVALPRRAVILTGRVAAIEPLPEGSRITIAHPSIDGAPPLARSLRVRLQRDDGIALAPGDIVRLRALVEPPSPPSYPGAWDLQRQTFFSDLGGYGFALGPARRLKAAPRNALAQHVEALRETIADRIRTALPGAAGAIAATLMTGLSTAIPAPDRTAFQQSGLAHLLAVAGLHIGIVMGFAFLLSRRLLALSEWASLHLPTKPLAAVTSLAAGGAYLLLTGAHLPIARSFTMASIAVLGLVTGRRAVSLRSLGLAATALLLVTPASATGVSFQMSFSAVLVLISGYDALRPRLSRPHAHPHGARAWPRRIGAHILGLGLTSLLAGTASLPFAAYHFGTIQLYYVLANLVAVPVTALWVMPAGLISLPLMPLHLERVALVPMGLGVRVLLMIAHAVAALPAARIAVPPMPAWGLGITSFGLAWLCLWRSPLRFASIPILIFGLATPLFSPPPDILVSDNGSLVGFATPKGVFLAKTGGGSSSFTRNVWQTLWRSGPLLPLPIVGTAAGGALRCTETTCLFRPHPHGPAVLLLRGKHTPHPCPDAALVIAPMVAPTGCADEGATVIDRRRLRRNGSSAIWLDRRPLILSDRALRGARPWVPEDKPHLAPELPMAKTVALPP